MDHSHRPSSIVHRQQFMNTSVVIPSYKRRAALLQTLQSLQEQTAAHFDIWVADNAVDEATRGAVETFNKTARVPVNYLPEPRLGVHYARNTASKAAPGELQLFTDDDMTFVPGWVQAYQDAFAQNPEIAAAGGPIHIKYEVTPPAWFTSFLATKAVNPFGYLDLQKPFFVSERGIFHSGNMAIRKSVLMARGGFHPEATGNIWVGDGETGLNHAMWRAGDKIAYVPDALNYHHIPDFRMTVNYLKRRQANEGAALAYNALHRKNLSNAQLLGYSAKLAARFPRHVLGGWLYAGRTDTRSLLIQLRTAEVRAQIGYAFKMMRDPKFRALVNKEDWIAE